MSHDAVEWVLTHSESRGLDRLVLISLAHHANRTTGACFPSMRTVAREAGVSLGKVAKSVAHLVAIGELGVAERGDQRRSTRYELPFLFPFRVHHVNAEFTPEVNAEFTPEVNRTTRNRKEQEKLSVEVQLAGAEVIELRPSKEAVQLALDGARAQIGRERRRDALPALRAASPPPEPGTRLQDSRGTSGSDESESAGDATTATGEGRSR